jgi:alpha-methylacyl-CoA racemase
VVSIAVNLPGPVAAARLASLGASVTKVEPPTGDPLALVCRPWYDELVRGQTVHTLDLKEEAGRARLHELLGSADLMITSHRAAGLERLGLGWADLQARHPRLCHVAIVGQPAPDDGLPGHDLTYQAAHGLLEPRPGETPEMPAVLVADLGGAERAATEALAALVHRSRTGQASRREVALTSAAAAMAAPLRHGLTTAGGLLGGALPAYGIYPAAVGHVALAALEPHFFARLTALLGVSGTRAELEAAFATRSAAEWEEWARAQDLPLTAVARAEAVDRTG